MTKLVASIEVLQGRKLTAEEAQRMHAIQKLYEISDDDPVLVVLAMMANAELTLGSAPALIEAMLSKTIELYRSVMRDQAVLISKELITVIAEKIRAANEGLQPPPRIPHWQWLVGTFGGGMFFMMTMLFVFKIYFR